VVADRLTPCPISRHQIAVLSLIFAEFLVHHVVDVAVEVRSGQYVLDHLARVSKPYLVHRGLPLWRPSCPRDRAVVLELGALPPNIANLDGINLVVEVSVVGEGWSVVVGNERCGP
jgi:hypothetical protein